MKLTAIIGAMALGVLAASGADASVYVHVYQEGANIVAEATGTLDLSSLSKTAVAPDGYQASVLGGFGFLALGEDTAGLDLYQGAFSGPSSFGPGMEEIAATSASGEALQIEGGFLVVSQSYVSGAAISSSATWENATFASLGLSEARYTYSWGSDSMELNIGNGIPEPSTWALMAIGFVGFGLFRGLGRQGTLTA